MLPARPNTQAAELLLTRHNFIHVLPGVFADEVLEKFFGQDRQRNGGNFYTGIVDITAAAETKNLHALLKYKSTPHQPHALPCTSVIFIDHYHFDIAVADAKDLIQSYDSLKYVILFLDGHPEHKFRR